MRLGGQPLSLFAASDPTPREGENGRPMAEHLGQEQPVGGGLYLQISNAVVRLLREYTGRSPTKARTTIRDNVVVVILEQTLTKGEHSLVEKGRADKVL